MTNHDEHCMAYKGYKCVCPAAPKPVVHYELIAFDNSDDNPRVLGIGLRAQVRENLARLRKTGLPGYRYIMRKLQSKAVSQ